MKFFDSHCHIDDKSYNADRSEVIKRAKDSGVESFIVVGINQRTSIKAIEIAESTSGVYASVGIHPHDAKACTENDLKFLYSLAKKPCVKAWGEAGLDFNRMFSSQGEQEQWFIRQIELAGSLNLPMIFHERDSKGRFGEIINLHYKNSKSSVVHCFGGDKKELSQYLDKGFYIGITGIVTLKDRGKELRSLINYIPNDKILIETDAPYLTPYPEKKTNRRNEPAFVKSVLFELAKIKNISPDALAEKIWGNTCRLFEL
ncbi:MAG: TatD family hydrolase [Desulfobacterales bacterium]|nr:TatD family hydrolase [Desulfobacterales bacterium]